MAWPQDVSLSLRDEVREYQVLWFLGSNMTTTGTTSYTSTTSGVTYNSSTGQSGILSQLAVTLASSLTSAAQMGRIGSLITSTTITAATTLTTSNFGSFIELAGTSYTVTLPTPVNNGGYSIEFWNSGSGVMTLSTPSGQFKGIGFTAATTYSMSSGSYVIVISDGTNYMLSDTSLVATQSIKDNSNKPASTAYVNGLFDGWIPLNYTFTYTSADTPTFTMTVSGIDLTGIIGIGNKIKLTQTTVEYFIVTAISFSTNTIITLYGGTDYTLSNAAIGSVYYSIEKCPIGFSLDPNKWSVVFNHTSLFTVGVIAANTWWDLTALKLTVPIGIWNLSGKAEFQAGYSSSGVVELSMALSSSSSAPSDNDLWAAVDLPNNTSGCLMANFSTQKSIATKTDFSLLIKSYVSTSSSTYIRGDNCPTIFKAVCVYL